MTIRQPNNRTTNKSTNPAKETVKPMSNVISKPISRPTPIPRLILALDFGVKKMGIALGNTLTQDARPLDIMQMNNGQPNWQALLTIIEEWQIQQVVVGLPLNMDGSDSMLAKRANKFSRRLAHRLMERRLDIEVCLHDERLSSYEARQIAWEQGWISQETDPIDDISACLLLNSYLRSTSN